MEKEPYLFLILILMIIIMFKLIKYNIVLYLRNLFYKRKFKKFGKGTKIYGRIICLGNNLEIGHHSTLNEGVLLNARGKLKIGNYCRLAPLVQIQTTGLSLDKDYKKRQHITKPVFLEDGVWLGYNSIITSGVTVGEGSVITPRSVVTKNVPKFEMWGGIPARKIKDLFIK